MRRSKEWAKLDIARTAVNAILQKTTTGPRDYIHCGKHSRDCEYPNDCDVAKRLLKADHVRGLLRHESGGREDDLIA